MGKFETHFISQNKLPGDGYIGVYNGTKLVGKVKANNLKMPELGYKLYSFGALSDVHATVSAGANLNGQTRFKAALKYFNDEEKVDFICIAGDLTGEGKVNESTDQFQIYVDCIAEAAPNTPVYEVTGNHDLQSPPATPFTAPITYLKNYTGHTLYYTVSNKPTVEDEENENYNYYNEVVSEGDVFIMLGMSGWQGHTGTDTFSEKSIDWLRSTLEKNSDKRCFLFVHPPRFDGSGKPYDKNPTGDLLPATSDTANAFKELIGSYQNVVYFHGHTHITFNSQKDCEYANYDRMYGCHSVHIPTTLNVKAINDTEDDYDTVTGESLGYIVDVYENHIVLRGVNFVNGNFVSIATYCIETGGNDG